MHAWNKICGNNVSDTGAHAYTALQKTPQPETRKAEISFQVEEEDHR
jgi:hypothetical protein